MDLLLQADPSHLAFVAVLAAAAGADLGLALVVLGVAPQLGWPDPPGSLALLQAPPVVASALALYGLEWWVERRARGFALWHTLQRWVRILALGLVGTMATTGDPLQLRIILVAFVTLFGTVVYMGASGWVALLILRELSPRAQRVSSLAVDVAFAALLVLAMEEPVQAAAALGALTVVAATQVAEVIRAHLIVARAGRGWFHLLMLPGRWLAAEDLPAVAREAVYEPGPPERRAYRGAPAALRTGRLRAGWLVLAAGRSFFVDRRGGSRELEPVAGEPARAGRLNVRKKVRADDEDAELLIFRDGPQMAELDREIDTPVSA